MIAENVDWQTITTERVNSCSTYNISNESDKFWLLISIQRRYGVLSFKKMPKLGLGTEVNHASDKRFLSDVWRNFSIFESHFISVNIILMLSQLYCDLGSFGTMLLFSSFQTFLVLSKCGRSESLSRIWVIDKSSLKLVNMTESELTAFNVAHK